MPTVGEPGEVVSVGSRSLAVRARDTFRKLPTVFREQRPVEKQKSSCKLIANDCPVLHYSRFREDHMPTADQMRQTPGEVQDSPAAEGLGGKHLGVIGLVGVG